MTSVYKSKMIDDVSVYIADMIDDITVFAGKSQNTGSA